MKFKLTKKRLRAELSARLAAAAAVWPAKDLDQACKVVLDHYYPGDRTWTVHVGMNMQDPHSPPLYDVQRGFDDIRSAYESTEELRAQSVADVLNAMEAGS